MQREWAPWFYGLQVIISRTKVDDHHGQVTRFFVTQKATKLLVVTFCITTFAAVSAEDVAEYGHVGHVWGAEEELPYWHLEHEVLLTEAKAKISDGAMEEAGGSEHQNQVEVPRKGCLERVKQDTRSHFQTCTQLP